MVVINHQEFYMSEEPVKYIKMADGTLAKVEFLTEESEQTIIIS